MSSSSNSANIDTIFSAAIELPSPEERAAYLDRMCGSDPAAREKLRKLLDAHFRASAGGFLDSPPEGIADFVDTANPSGSAPSELGTTIGPFRLLQQIGEGGMGIVFMAEQLRPVHRKVALKIMKPGLDTREVLARFEAERQALALMDHPNIAKVFDAGTTDTGRSYFAMELVKGVSITKYCDDNHLTPRQRLELFIPVCEAVQHAHQKGIIHRDLKPSNVLIALYDGKPVPKVIDFGVAKAAGQRLTERTLFTAFGGIIGTLEYMSPEQAELNQLDVDTRSDIYSLGVLLYELLTGTTPLQRDQLKQSALNEVLRLIREEEPQKPSTRLMTSHELPALAVHRGLEPAKLSGAVRGELDWIVMKALEKDRSRRYDTAIGLARDVQRYLNDENVTACPPSVSYRLRKLARRNKRMLAAAAFVFAALVAGTIVSTWQAIRATRSSALADLRLHQAEKNFQSACDAVDQMLSEVGQESLAHIPQVEPVRKALLEKALKFYQSFLEVRSTDVQLQRQVARGFARVAGIETLLGDQRQAEQDFRHAIKLLQSLSDSVEDQRELAQTHSRLAGILRDTGRREDAGNEYRTALSILGRLSAADPDNQRLWEDLADAHHSQAALLRMLFKPRDAEDAYSKAIALREKLCKTSESNARYTQELARSHFSFALLLNETNRVKESETSFRRAIELSAQVEKQFPHMEECRNIQAASYTFLGNLLRRDNQLDNAQLAYEKAIALAQGLVADFPRTVGFRRQLAMSQYHLALNYRAANQADKTIESLRSSVEQYERLMAEAPSVQAHLKELLQAQKVLFDQLIAANRTNEADLLRVQMTKWERQQSDQQRAAATAAIATAAATTAPSTRAQHPVQHQLDLVLRARTAKRWDEALTVAERAIAVAEQLLRTNPDSPENQRYYGLALRECGRAHVELKQSAKGEPYHRRSLEVFEQLASAYPEEPRYKYDLARCYLNLSIALRNARRLDESETAIRKSLALAPGDPEMLMSFGTVLWEQDLLSQAEATYRDVLRIKPDIPGGRFNLAYVLQNQGRIAEALAEFREILRTRPKDLTTLNAIADLLIVYPRMGSPDETMAIVQQLVAAAPANPSYLNSLAFAHYRSGQWNESLATVEKAMKLRKPGADDSWDYAVLSMVHWQLGHRDEALKSYEAFAARYIPNRYNDANTQQLRIEAGLLIDAPDPTPHALRAAQLLEQHQRAEAEAELRIALAIKTDDTHSNCLIASLLGRFGRWQEAFATYRLALQSQDYSHTFFSSWSRLATLSLYLDDASTFRKTSTTIIATTQPSNNAYIQNHIALLGLLLPDFTADHPQVLDRAQRASNNVSPTNATFSISALVRALAEYRTSKTAESLATLENISPNPFGDAIDAAFFAVRAMNHHRLGNLDDARAALAQAQGILNEKTLDAPGSDFGEYWAPWMRARILFREAQSLVSSSPSADPEPSAAGNSH